MKKVLLVNWDSYPHVTTGGVYSWEKVLVESLSDYRFTVVNLLSNPNANGVFAVPTNVEQVIDIPIFGSQRYEEFYKDGGRSLQNKIFSTTDKVVTGRFMPLFRNFLRELLRNDSNPKALADCIFELHRFLRDHDAKKSLEHSA